MKFGISSVIYESQFIDLSKETKELDKVYLKYVDAIVKFALKHKIKIIELSGFLSNISEILPPLVNQINKKLEPFKEVSFHLPIKFRPAEETKITISAAKELGARIMVYHTEYMTHKFDTEKERKNNILELISFCKKRDLMLCVENLPLEVKKFHRPEEFDFYIKKGAYFTLDTGHSIICGIDPVKFLDRFGNKVRDIHLQSGFIGMPDLHYAIGDGDFDYMGFFKKLKEIKYYGLVILEMLAESTALDSLRQLKKLRLI